jgi:hypothetical protein
MSAILITCGPFFAARSDTDREHLIVSDHYERKNTRWIDIVGCFRPLLSDQVAAELPSAALDHCLVALTPLLANRKITQ